MPWRRPFLMLVISAAIVAGCGPSSQPDAIWGSWGTNDGKFSKPRAAAIDKNDRLFIVDYSARIQVFDLSGKYIGPTWTTPDYRNGRPSGLSLDRDGNILVSDSHYNCFRIYSPEGKELKRFTMDDPNHQFTYDQVEKEVAALLK